IFSLATLTGWGMIFLQLKRKKLDGEIVLGDGNIHYHKPISMQPRAQVYIEHFQCEYAELQEGKKMQVTLKVHILDGDTAVAEFTGVYWVLPRM
ncbi:MAG: GNAT family N-acetyltransferase, partial [Glaciecola sp.]|nr:GNAT family N-acetyltransferase [Glaciecola sp.]